MHSDKALGDASPTGRRGVQFQGRVWRTQEPVRDPIGSSWCQGVRVASSGAAVPVNGDGLCASRVGLIVPRNADVVAPRNTGTSRRDFGTLPASPLHPALPRRSVPSGSDTCPGVPQPAGREVEGQFSHARWPGIGRSTRLLTACRIAGVIVCLLHRFACSPS